MTTPALARPRAAGRLLSLLPPARLSRPEGPPLAEATGPALERALARSAQAEWNLAHQGARVLLARDHASGWLVRQAGRHLVALGLPLGPADLPALAATASASRLRPILYKCDGRSALAARGQGWSVLRIGHEAVLDLATWTTARSACRQLRRKLRAARSAGIRVTLAAGLPLDRMGRVQGEWLARHGRERGFSMGRFDPALLRRQRVLLAWSGESLVAFASFHANREEWTLDLMRQGDEVPDGTMHLLVAEAASLALASGAGRLSLAAIPDPLGALPRLRRLAPRPCGLAQFKKAFGPRLSPRYAAAPDRALLMSGLLTVARAIHGPVTLPGPRPVGRPWNGPTSALLGIWPGLRNFAFEPWRVPCDARARETRPAAISSRWRLALRHRPDP